MLKLLLSCKKPAPQKDCQYLTTSAMSWLRLECKYFSCFSQRAVPSLPYVQWICGCLFSKFWPGVPSFACMQICWLRATKQHAHLSSRGLLFYLESWATEFNGHSSCGADSQSPSSLYGTHFDCLWVLRAQVMGYRLLKRDQTMRWICWKPPFW